MVECIIVIKIVQMKREVQFNSACIEIGAHSMPPKDMLCGPHVHRGQEWSEDRHLKYNADQFTNEARAAKGYTEKFILQIRKKTLNQNDQPCF